jgi:tetratricopeptide (TPR) repeat protein
MPLLVLPVIVLLALVAYWPGLHGGFLFDDFINLPALGDTGPIDHWPTFWRYITSGNADMFGRPLTLLSFLLDAHDWPAEPYPFKRTSLMLHLLNGVLLYALLARLGQALDIKAPRYRTAALLGTALWLLHPLLVSTTLYIVQREAMLPATCVLIGLLIWLHGRSQLLAGEIGTGLLWSVVGLGGFTLLAVLAKANGALLPLYALLIEVIVLLPRQRFATDKGRHAHRTLLLVFAVLPSAAIGTYLIWVGVHGIFLGGNADGRSWTYAQRLLTEPRVLVDYLTLLWLPRPFSSGLFNDQYVASVSLLRPLSTLLAILLVALSIGAAWWLRRRHPALALAVLFYFAGQLLESTSIPLELYFEHRNYTPALLMFWPLGLWLADTRTLSVLKRVLMTALPIGLALMTHARAEVWGNLETQALVWAQINPDSPRAQAYAAQVEMQTGHPREAAQRLQKLLRSRPDEVQLAFNLIGARCVIGEVSASDLATARTAMLGTPNTAGLFASWFERMLPVSMAGSCEGLSPMGLLGLIDAGLQNPKLATAGPQQDFTYLRGRIALAQHQPDTALADFTHALDLQVRPGMALKAAAMLGAAGYPSHGLRLLDHYQQVQGMVESPPFGMPMLHAWVLSHEGYWPRELAHLRHQLSLDVGAGTTNAAPFDPDLSTTH